MKEKSDIVSLPCSTSYQKDVPVPRYSSLTLQQ